MRYDTTDTVICLQGPSGQKYVCHLCDMRYDTTDTIICLQGPSGQKYVCHLCDMRYDRGHRLTLHLKNKHKFKWPSGHNRFR